MSERLIDEKPLGFDEEAYRQACKAVFGEGPRNPQLLLLIMKILSAYETAKGGVA